MVSVVEKKAVSTMNFTMLPYAINQLMLIPFMDYYYIGSLKNHIQIEVLNPVLVASDSRIIMIKRVKYM
jgi:hypothetical protein